MRRLERRQDALVLGERLEAGQGLGIGHVAVLAASQIAQPGVLGAHRGVVEAGRDRVRQLDVPCLVLQHERARALQHAGAAAGEPRGVATGDDAFAAGLDADQPHALVVEEAVEDADGVAAAADARHHHVGQPAQLRQDLAARLTADHRLELAHHQRIGMRAQRRSEQVIGVLDVGDPVAHRLVDGVLQRLAARVDLAHRRPQQLHAHDVQRLAPHVLAAHVDDALEAQQRAGRRRRHPVLPRARLGHHAAFAHALGQQRLAERVVDLVGAGVRQVLALQQQAHTGDAGALGHEAARLVEGRWAPDEMGQQIVQLGPERGVGAHRQIAFGQLLDGRDQRLGHEPAAVGAKVAAGVGIPPSEYRCLHVLLPSPPLEREPGPLEEDRHARRILHSWCRLDT